MAHQVEWTQFILNTFLYYIDEYSYRYSADVLEEMKIVMRTRFAGWSRTKQCHELHLSMSTLDRRIAALKELYDDIRLKHPDANLPIRRTSNQEVWMDTH